MTLPRIRTNPITSDYGWNERAGRYVDLETKRFIKSSQVRDALESVMDGARDQISNLTQQLRDQAISLAQWQTGMMEQIKLIHTAAGAAANGGWAQMSRSDWGAVGSLVREQYKFLRNFAGQIADGKQPLDGRALVRADLYGEAGRGSFEEMRRRYEQNSNGMNFERRVLGEADHCEGCLDQADQGWQPIGTLEPIGAMECQTKCHCTFEYSETNPDEEE